MRSSVVQLFSLYNFFSVFVPGFVFVLGVVPLLPEGARVTAVTSLVPVLALAFVVGQGIHSLAVRVEAALGHDGHRTRFADELVGRTGRFDDALVREFWNCYRGTDFSTPVDFEADENTDPSVARTAIYVLVQSYVHTAELGRSRNFQAVYAFCRSLWFGSFCLTFLYWSFALYATVLNLGYHPIVPATDSLLELLVLSTTVCGLCVFVFKYAADQYREHFVQYLLADFVVLSRRAAEDR